VFEKRRFYKAIESKTTRHFVKKFIQTQMFDLFIQEAEQQQPGPQQGEREDLSQVQNVIRRLKRDDEFGVSNLKGNSGIFKPRPYFWREIRLSTHREQFGESHVLR